MAITYVTVGTAAGQVSGAITLIYPAGIAANDIIACGVVLKHSPAVPTTPASFTLVTVGTGGQGANQVDSGTLTTSGYYRIAAGTESGGTVIFTTASGNGGQGCMTVYRPTSSQYSWVTPTGDWGADNSAGTAWITVTSGTMDVIAGDVVFVTSGVNSDANTFSAENLNMGGISSWTSHSERLDSASSTGNDTRLVLSDHFAAAGTANTAGTFTMTANGSTAGTRPAGASVMLRLREQWARGTVTPGEGIQAQTGDNAIVYGAYPVTCEEGAQAQIMDVPEVSFSEGGGGPIPVTPEDGFQAQTGDGATVLAGYPLTVAEGAQTQSGDAAVVRAGYNMAPAEGNQTQTGDAPTVRAGYVVTFTEGNQAQTGDTATLTEVVGNPTVTPVDGFQAQAGDAATVRAGYNLSPTECNQSQSGDTATVRATYLVSPVDGFQTQTGDSPVVFAGYFVVSDQGYQTQTMDAVTLTELVAASAQTPRQPVIMVANSESIFARSVHIDAIRADINAEQRKTIKVE